MDNLLPRHNENSNFRFILPLLPLSLMYAGFGLSQIHLSNSRWKSISYLLIAINVPAIVYFSRFHQLAPLSVMDYLKVATKRN